MSLDLLKALQPELQEIAKTNLDENLGELLPKFKVADIAIFNDELPVDETNTDAGYTIAVMLEAKKADFTPEELAKLNEFLGEDLETEDESENEDTIQLTQSFECAAIQ